ncbi:hypothetical protein BDY21DRAFT_360644 [Lineolata rhizophorae]|uniref:Uncharacterized protein n=1 Tax=Lineolata rhizophorae TaxID=578093 RepID=A0A6A6PC77_9PEZI|nr:hypothetical protein BDY21DRAFT_360644 [Lineolata rhizophorae]
MKNKLCCTASDSRSDSPPLLPTARLHRPRSRVSFSQLDSHPWRPAATSNPAPTSSSAAAGGCGRGTTPRCSSRFTSTRTEELQSLRRIFDNAAEGPGPGGTAGAGDGCSADVTAVSGSDDLPRSLLMEMEREMEPSSPAAEPKMKSVGQALQRKLLNKMSRDLKRENEKEEKEKDKEKWKTSLGKKKGKDDLRARKAEIRKELFSEEAPEEGGYDEDAEEVGSVEERLDAQTPVSPVRRKDSFKRPDVHSIQWSSEAREDVERRTSPASTKATHDDRQTPSDEEPTSKGKHIKTESIGVHCIPPLRFSGSDLALKAPWSSAFVSPEASPSKDNTSEHASTSKLVPETSATTSNAETFGTATDVLANQGAARSRERATSGASTLRPAPFRFPENTTEQKPRSCDASNLSDYTPTNPGQQETQEFLPEATTERDDERDSQPASNQGLAQKSSTLSFGSCARPSRFKEDLSPPERHPRKPKSVLSFVRSKTIHHIRSHQYLSDGASDIPWRKSISRASLREDLREDDREEGRDVIWERALKAHQREKRALYLSSNQNKARSNSMFRERSVSASRSRKRSSCTSVGVDPLESKESQGAVSDVSPLATPGIQDGRSSSISNMTFPGSRRPSLGRSVSSLALGAWARYPSHTRGERNRPAGTHDNVFSRDFAVEAAKRAEEAKAHQQHDEQQHEQQQRLLASAASGGSASPSPSSTTPRLRRPPGLKKTKTGLSKSSSMSFGRSFLKNYAHMFRSQSTEFRRFGHGHRGSTSTSGTLTRPELEVLPEVMAPPARLPTVPSDPALRTAAEDAAVNAVPTVDNTAGAGAGRDRSPLRFSPKKAVARLHLRERLELAKDKNATEPLINDGTATDGADEASRHSPSSPFVRRSPRPSTELPHAHSMFPLKTPVHDENGPFFDVRRLSRSYIDACVEYPLRSSVESNLSEEREGLSNCTNNSSQAILKPSATYPTMDYSERSELLDKSNNSASSGNRSSYNGNISSILTDRPAPSSYLTVPCNPWTATGLSRRHPSSSSRRVSSQPPPTLSPPSAFSPPSSPPPDALATSTSSPLRPPPPIIHQSPAMHLTRDARHPLRHKSSDLPLSRTAQSLPSTLRGAARAPREGSSAGYRTSLGLYGQHGPDNAGASTGANSARYSQFSQCVGGRGVSGGGGGGSGGSDEDAHALHAQRRQGQRQQQQQHQHAKHESAISVRRSTLELLKKLQEAERAERERAWRVAEGLAAIERLGGGEGA